MLRDLCALLFGIWAVTTSAPQGTCQTFPGRTCITAVNLVCAIGAEVTANDELFLMREAALLCLLARELRVSHELKFCSFSTHVVCWFPVFFRPPHTNPRRARGNIK